MNYLKTAALMALLMAIFVAVGQLIGGPQGATMALLMALVMNVITYWFSDKMVLAMYRAKPIPPADAPELHEIIERLSVKAGIPKPRVYLIPQRVPNAFATGRNPKHAAVAVTEGILDLLDAEEVEGVLAHELGHVKHRDTLIMCTAAAIAGAISYLAQMAQWSMMFGGGHRDRENRGSNGLQLVGLLVTIILAPLAAMLVQMAISRSREYGADARGATLAGGADGLINALQKLEAAAQHGKLETNPATASLFIVNPLRGDVLASLFSTHPPMPERLRRLRALRG